jgi:hypothetical protein
MFMYARIACAVALLAIASAPSSALDFVHRKAGLWTVTTAMEGAPVKLGPMKMCLDANTDARLMQQSMQWKQDACSPPVIAGSGLSRTVDVVCHLDGATQKSHIAMNFAGDASYHMDMTSQSTPARFGRGSVHMTQDAKWSGACPKNMKPGDMIIGSMTINVLDAGSGGMGRGHLTKEQIEALIKAHRHP